MLILLYQDSDSWPPVLRKKGRLRQLMRDAFAAQLMYYAERHEHKEMQKVNVWLQECVVKANMQGDGAHDKLILWSALLKGKFNADNLCITAPPGTLDMVCTHVWSYTYYQ